jgi:hypothetical protein
VSSLKMSWQTERDQFVCRWSELGKRVQYNPQWIQVVSRSVHGRSGSAPSLDFTKLSPFGGSGWYGSGRVR